MQNFRKIFRELSRAKIKYLVTGDAAVNFYGYLRFINSVDILLPEVSKNMAITSKIIPNLKVPVTINVRVVENELFEKLYRAKKTRKSGKIIIPIVSIGELIKMKKTKNPIDLIDIIYLKRLRRIKNRPIRKPRWNLDLELEQLRDWKYTRTDAVINWLDESYNFARAVK